ncbi:MAG: helix-hairpin-helix domain-containing protein [Myxococcales bacterium]|nr:helix-hairpin-helix domain-containing protein [Myxococcales bacterium]
MPPSTHSLYGALGVLLCAMAVVSLAHRALSRREPRATASPGLPADVTPEVAKLVQAVAPAPPEVARAAEPRPPSPAARALRDGGRLDLNRATEADLQLLPRIGPALSERIVAYRSHHGPFVDVASLADVPGVGPATIARLRPLVRAGASGPSEAVEDEAHTQRRDQVRGVERIGVSEGQDVGAHVEAEDDAAAPEVVHAEQRVHREVAVGARAAAAQQPVHAETGEGDEAHHVE